MFPELSRRVNAGELGCLGSVKRIQKKALAFLKNSCTSHRDGNDDAQLRKLGLQEMVNETSESSTNGGWEKQDDELKELGAPFYTVFWMHHQPRFLHRRHN